MEWATEGTSPELDTECTERHARKLAILSCKCDVNTAGVRSYLCSSCVNGYGQLPSGECQICGEHGYTTQSLCAPARTVPPSHWRCAS